MTFSHPLARDAKVWAAVEPDGNTRNILVIVTTLSLDPAQKRFKGDKVDRLKGAAQAWLLDHKDAAHGYMLVNRVKDWDTATGSEGKQAR